MQTFNGITGLVLRAAAIVGQPPRTFFVPAHHMQAHKVTGAGLRRRQETSWPKGRAAKRRCAGAAGKLRP